MAHSIQIREKVLAARARGESAASIARRLEISERAVYYLQRRARDGRAIKPEKTGPRKPSKLTEADLQLLRQIVKQKPGITAKAAAQLLSVQVVESTVCRAWKRLGITFKKSR